MLGHCAAVENEPRISKIILTVVGTEWGMMVIDAADLWRDQESNLALIELAHDPRLAGKENGWAEPAVNG